MHLNIDFMPIVPLFLLKLSVSLAVVWGFYQVVLRRLTFYGLNRWYLLGYTLLSFYTPLINIGPMLPDGPAGEPVILQFIPAIGGGGVAAVAPLSRAAGPSVWTVLGCVVAAGSVLLLARVAIRWMSLLRLRRKARLIEGEGVKIYQVDGRIIPFSFGNAIYINQHLHTEKEWTDIILHEYVHIRQKHTIDILLAELVCILNWYNPFAWLIRYSIRQNLEFIADQQVLDKGVDRKGYQYLLLKVVGEPAYRLANNFNFSSLKKRIVMMNKMQSARVHLLKLLFLLPLVAVLLAAFRDRGAQLFRSHGPVYVNAAGIVISLPDRKPLEGVMARDLVTGLQTTTDVRGYYKLKIPVVADLPVRVHLTFTKAGYDSTFTEQYCPMVAKTRGLMLTGAVVRQSVPFKGAFAVFPGMPNQEVPIDPGYADAEKELNRVLKGNDDVMRYLDMQKDHPEVSLFYETEDGQKEIIVHTDGTIERYGYPGTPALGEMKKKYGDMQGYMATNHPTGPRANSGYLSRWEAIGEEAQREFHTTNPNVRAVIFPGDSRVIAVPVSGKTRYYDLDNDASNERAEFERLYGKLPDCVPKAGFNSDEMERSIRLAPRTFGGAGDTVPGTRKDTANRIIRLHRGDTVPVEQKDESKVKRPLVFSLNGDSSARVLFIVDGKETSADTMKSLDPDQIESITVLKDSSSMERYGGKGRNGVLLIKLKHPGGFNATPRGQGGVTVNDKDGRWTMVEDSVEIGNLKVTAIGPRGN